MTFVQRTLEQAESCPKKSAGAIAALTRLHPCFMQDGQRQGFGKKIGISMKDFLFPFQAQSAEMAKCRTAYRKLGKIR